MQNLLKTPFFPQEKVKAVAVSGENKQVVSSLNNLGIDTIIIEPNKNLEEPIRSHADCMVAQLNENILLVDESQYDLFIRYLDNNRLKFNNYSSFVNFLTSKKGELEKQNSIKEQTTDTFNLIKCSQRVFSPYPNDVKLNVKISGNSILCNNQFVADDIRSFADIFGYKIIHCNQGYVGCSSILLNDNTILTADKSICHSAASNGFFVNELSIGQIKLSGYDYGFIGGCCGMIDKNLITFTGKLENHRDYEIIKRVLEKHKINYINLTDNELTDIGGIIPILE